MIEKRLEHKNTKIIASFCGTGKTYICNESIINAIEIEYWKYKDNELQKEYIEDIEKQFNTVDYIFISTDLESLKLLHEKGYTITLIYPENSLRSEYLDRYIARDSPCDFIGAFMKYWNLWINELKNQKYCNHIVLKQGEYLSDFLKKDKCTTTKKKNKKEPNEVEIEGLSEKEIAETLEKLNNCIMPKNCKNKWNTEKQTDLNRYFTEL